MKNWKKETVTPAIREGFARIPFLAPCKGGFAVHRSINPSGEVSREGGWNLSHVATGLLVAGPFDLRAQAVAAGEALIARFPGCGEAPTEEKFLAIVDLAPNGRRIAGWIARGLDPEAQAEAERRFAEAGGKTYREG